MVSAAEVAQVGQIAVEAKVYKVDKLNRSMGLKELLAEATLEHSPRLVSDYGTASGLRLDFPNATSAMHSALEIIVVSDPSSMTYDIDINLLNGNKENISRITDHPIGQTFIASTIIDDAARVIQIDVLEAASPMATFVLQVASNLACDALTIALNSQATSHYLEFTTGAFASVSMPKGEFTFGDVICRTGETQQRFDVLQDKLMPIVVDAGKTYFGGRLIFKQVEQAITNRSPQNLEDCRPMHSRARGEKQDNLCDYANVTSYTDVGEQIEVYMPEVTDGELETLSQALSLESGTLTYLPVGLEE